MSGSKDTNYVLKNIHGFRVLGLLEVQCDLFSHLVSQQ